MNKALNLWLQSYDSARSVMPIETALDRADAVLLEKMGIGISLFEEGGNHVWVKVALPGGGAVLKSCVGYITPTIRRRLTEQALASLTPKTLRAIEDWKALLSTENPGETP